MLSMYTDFHTHILPRLDDGAANKEISLQMLYALERQNVDRIVFTPHFYVDLITVPDFLTKRRHAFESINEQRFHSIDKKLGAEVYLVPGLSALEGLELLCIENTDYLLLELPYRKITPQIIREIEIICSEKGLHILFAHIDRYFKFITAEELTEVFGCCEAVYQVSTECFKDPLKRKGVWELMSYNVPVVLGTDAHNTTTRPPDFCSAVKVIKKKCGQPCLQQICDCSDAIFANAIAL